MAQFITRVELHGATAADHVALERLMAEQSFARTIPGTDGLTYMLPAGEFFSFGGVNAADVRALASGAAAKTGRAFWILVSQAEDIAWSLKPVEVVVDPAEVA